MRPELFERRFGRRGFLKMSAALAAASLVPAGVIDVRRALAAGTLRQPGSLPFPTRPAGVPQPDLAPELANIDHIIVVMMENHSFDNYFGMLPYRYPALSGRVDGWPALDSSGIPAVTQVDASNVTQHSYRLVDGCQPLDISQSWNASHLAYDGGQLDGFCKGSSKQALGFWDEQVLPFYYSLASLFPVCDRYFSSTLCQTYPNRVFAMAGTAAGLVSTDTPPPTVTPANGHIFDVLEAHSIGWADYYSELPSPGLFGASWAAMREGTNLFGPSTAPQGAIAAFQAACNAGTLPPIVMVEADYQWGSEENPQNIQVGQTFAAGVINALMSSPAWASSLLVFTYDEHGGYYDHVVPPAALNPGDGSHPNIATTYGDDYTLLGFRVPTVIVSPWAKSGFTSHTVYDHTSILATIERKFNLPALTLRDANANDLSDCLVSSGPAPFATPPALAAAPFRTEADSIACEQTGSDPLPSSSAPEAPLTPLLLGGAAAGGAAATMLRRARRGAPATPANPV
ncbi:MAG TPA: alkaline phosphatase family protein [Candidatus Dormibacteraeota bacterium]|nr:alkaline phosphatase family protein [Candidatus Dormibacteraeota bacterium]